MMNRRAYSTFAAAMLTMVLGAHPAAAQAVLQRCDKFIADAETMATRVSECKRLLAAAAKSLAETEKTGAKASVPVMKEVFVSSGIPTDIAAAAMAEPQLLDKLKTYYSVLAFDAGNPGPCAQIAYVGQEGHCRVAYGDLIFMRARVGSPADFLKSCRQEAVADALFVKRGSIAAFCASIAQAKEEPAALCPKLASYYIKQPPPGVCEASLSDSLRPGACNALTDDDAELCPHRVLYARAFQARDISVCGDSDRCRVLMGGGAQVAKKLAAGLKSPTAQWFLKGGGRLVTKLLPAAPPVPTPTAEVATPAQKSLTFAGFVCVAPMRSPQNRKAASAPNGAAQLCLKDVDAALAQTDVATVKIIDERIEKLARLQTDVDAIFDVGQPAAKK